MSDIKRMREMTRKEWRQEEVSGGLSFIGGEGIDVTSFDHLPTLIYLFEGWGLLL